VGVTEGVHIVRVDAANQMGPWDGRTWATAFSSLHDGLDAAEAMVGEVSARPQVWVAGGVYKPDWDGDRTAAFRLRASVDLYGGFRGDESALEQRDWTLFESILSGAVGASREEGSLHVVVAADDAVIDGFTICDGFNLPGGPPPHHMSPHTLLAAQGEGVGAGILCLGCAPAVRHCVIRDNVAAKGAGMYNLATRQWPTDETRPAPQVEDCTFLRNDARARGGAVCNDLMTHPAFVDCSFLHNHSAAKGGAMYNDFDCSPTLMSCLFAGNVAHKGGAMANDGRSSPVITNCTFTRNHATAAYGALYSGTGPANVPNAPVVTNCIIWGDTADAGPAEIGDWHDCGTAVTYSCVEGGHAGEGNVDADPRFVDPDRGDFRLGAGSPCVDRAHGGAASPTDRDGAGRYDDRGCPTGPFARVPHFPPGAHLPEPSLDAGLQPPVDMGAYERQEPSVDPEAPRVVFVNGRNTRGPWDGRSWATAFTGLQEALGLAYLGAEEIWVAAGTYRTTGDGDRRGSFCLLAGLELYGGFAGGEERREQRDWRVNVTTLSGDLGSPLGAAGDAYHVVMGADGAILDGFTIADGCADGAGVDGHGAGLLCYNAVAPAVRNCRFTRLRARDGGAVYAYNLSSPSFSDCDFVDCHAENGGAVVARVGSSPDFKDCRFVGDSARWRGGAAQIDYGSGPSFRSSTFESCTSGGHGGALFLESVAAQIGVIGTTIEECTFAGNSAALRGGAVGAADASEPLIAGCTFTANRAGAGGGAISADERVTVTVRSCVFEGNDGGSGAADIDTDDASAVVREGDAAEGWPST
jgi:predicted outer membrane repeat protein